MSIRASIAWHFGQGTFAEVLGSVSGAIEDTRAGATSVPQETWAPACWSPNQVLGRGDFCRCNLRSSLRAQWVPKLWVAANEAVIHPRERPAILVR